MKTKIMQTHTNLEELLIDFLLTLDRHELLVERLDIVKTATNYASRNSLALGKPEPLAKNKQTEKPCYICSGDLKNYYSFCEEHHKDYMNWVNKAKYATSR